MYEDKETSDAEEQQCDATRPHESPAGTPLCYASEDPDAVEEEEVLSRRTPVASAGMVSPAKSPPPSLGTETTAPSPMTYAPRYAVCSPQPGAWHVPLSPISSHGYPIATAIDVAAFHSGHASPREVPSECTHGSMSPGGASLPASHFAQVAAQLQAYVSRSSGRAVGSPAVDAKPIPTPQFPDVYGLASPVQLGTSPNASYEGFSPFGYFASPLLGFSPANAHAQSPPLPGIPRVTSAGSLWLPNAAMSVEAAPQQPVPYQEAFTYPVPSYPLRDGGRPLPFVGAAATQAQASSPYAPQAPPPPMPYSNMRVSQQFPPNYAAVTCDEFMGRGIDNSWARADAPQFHPRAPQYPGGKRNRQRQAGATPGGVIGGQSPSRHPGVVDRGQRVVASLMSEVLPCSSDHQEAAALATEILRSAMDAIRRSFPDLPDFESPASRGCTPMMLAHPDEFKNPSSFLKIYGDPLCYNGGAPLPKKGKNGNWECYNCTNVNYPRRFRCNKCNTLRDADSDKAVSEYTRFVYNKYVPTFKAGTGLLNTASVGQSLQ
eukprot:Polyplicarium_translucidae@DN2041_c0_g1_i1.p1